MDKKVTSQQLAVATPVLDTATRPCGRCPVALTPPPLPPPAHISQLVFLTNTFSRPVHN